MLTIFYKFAPHQGKILKSFERFFDAWREVSLLIWDQKNLR